MSWHQRAGAEEAHQGNTSVPQLDHQQQTRKLGGSTLSRTSLVITGVLGRTQDSLGWLAERGKIVLKAIDKSKRGQRSGVRYSAVSVLAIALANVLVQL